RQGAFGKLTEGIELPACGFGGQGRSGAAGQEQGGGEKGTGGSHSGLIELNGGPADDRVGVAVGALQHQTVLQGAVGGSEGEGFVADFVPVGGGKVRGRGGAPNLDGDFGAVGLVG